METTLRLTMSGSQNNTLFDPKWNRQVQEAFDLYHELEDLRDRVYQVDTMLAIDECLCHFLYTLNSVVTDLGQAPLASEQPVFKDFMRQIARRLQAENRTVKSLIRQVTTSELNPILEVNVVSSR